MAISKNNIIYLLNKVVPLLKELNISWWLGRGVLRHFHLTREVGDKNSDLDFHIWDKDKQILREKLIPIFSTEGYTTHEPWYKLAFFKPSTDHEFFIEFMFLFEYADSPGLVYHSRDKDKKYAPKVCFSNYKIIEIENIKLRIPVSVEQYFLGAYGPNWKNNNPNDKEFQSTPSIFNIGGG